ncbi:hypothetical protein ACXAT6_000613 [Clostridium sporogenes]
MRGGKNMSKSYEELATEMTVAWLNAVGQSCATGKFNGSWLHANSVKDSYKTFYTSIIESVTNNNSEIE